MSLDISSKYIADSQHIIQGTWQAQWVTFSSSRGCWIAKSAAFCTMHNTVLSGAPLCRQFQRQAVFPWRNVRGWVWGLFWPRLTCCVSFCLCFCSVSLSLPLVLPPSRKGLSYPGEELQILWSTAMVSWLGTLFASQPSFLKTHERAQLYLWRPAQMAPQLQLM